MEILTALAEAIETPFKQTPRQAKTTLAKAERQTAKPVLQLNPLPITLNTHLYKNPKSSANPNGDLKPLFRFRQLVDPIPGFSRYYYASSGSTEHIYRDIIQGACVPPSSTFTAQVINDAQKTLKANALERMDGLAGSWYPVYASPQDWYEADDSHYRKITLAKLTGEGGNGSFCTLAGDDHLSLQAGAKRLAFSKETTIHSIEMKYLMVTFRRPWLHSLLFDTNDWYLAGQGAGFCSSGSVKSNPGVLPLITTGMLLGKEVCVNADWGNEDKALLKDAQDVFLGPFRVFPSQKPDTGVQVIAWISDLVPYSPKVAYMSGENGTVTVLNHGAYIARFSVQWEENGAAHEQKDSGNFPILNAKSIEIPKTAINISLKIEIMTFPKPFETWSTVTTKSFKTPVVKTFKLKGTTFKPKVSEI